MTFELFVAGRYLRAKRKEKFISLVTILSVCGVAVGAAALVVAMAINNGVQLSLQRYLSGAMSHVSLLQKERGFGIENWRTFLEQFEGVDHVAAVAPALYGEVMLSSARSRGAILKGIDPDRETDVAGLLSNLREGSLEDLRRPGDFPGIILGESLADYVGARLDALITVINPLGEPTPYGFIPVRKRFRVAGIARSGYWEYDSRWAFASLEATQQALNVDDVINAVEFKLDDVSRTSEVRRELETLAGAQFAATTWEERNEPLMQALQVEKLVTTVTIGLIMLVAALNILTSLVMIVMEKSKDIAILKSMGAGTRQIRRIFVWQGLLIGLAGTVAGLILGHGLSWVCESYKLIALDQEVYGLAYVPFAPQPLDAVIVAAVAMLTSYLTTIYPSGSAARLVPVEVLRYE